MIYLLYTSFVFSFVQGGPKVGMPFDYADLVASTLLIGGNVKIEVSRRAGVVVETQLPPVDELIEEGEEDEADDFNRVLTLK